VESLLNAISALAVDRERRAARRRQKTIWLEAGTDPLSASTEVFVRKDVAEVCDKSK
jgi:hypothetical protein